MNKTQQRYNGMNKASDWIDKSIVTTRILTNGYAELPKGTPGIVTGVSRGTLQLKLNACTCCNIKVFMSQVSYFDVKESHGN